METPIYQPDEFKPCIFFPQYCWRFRLLKLQGQPLQHQKWDGMQASPVPLFSNIDTPLAPTFHRQEVFNPALLRSHKHPLQYQSCVSLSLGQSHCCYRDSCSRVCCAASQLHHREHIYYPKNSCPLSTQNARSDSNPYICLSLTPTLRVTDHP